MKVSRLGFVNGYLLQDELNYLEKGNRKQVYAGYSVLQAENIEEAKKLLKGHPHLAWNADCTIEVHETMALPGM